MHNLLFLLIIFCFSTKTEAWPAESYQIAELGFYRRPTLPVAPRDLDRALLASVELSLLKTNERTGSLEVESGCSGVLLNKSGYVLTAAHCVWECLRTNRLANFYKLKKSFVVSTKNSAPTNSFCSIRLPEYNIDGAELVAVGAAQVLAETSEASSSEQQVVFDMARYDEDFALLKFDLGRPAKACMRIADQRPSLGERVWTVGFPAKTIGRGEFNSLGSSNEYISYGRVIDFYSERLFQRPAQKENLRRLLGLNPDIRLFADTDAFSGNSGGMLTNESSELVGIVSQIFCPKFAQTIEGVSACFSNYFPGNTLAVSAPYVKDKIQKLLGSSRSGEIFNCTD